MYNDLLYASLKSARLNTSLDLYALYDGSTEGRCYEILKEFNVNIILHKFSHKQYLEKVYPKEFLLQNFGRDASYDKIAGAFMRLDIPFIEKEDEYVWYKDIDVIFQKDVSECNFGKVEYLAASTEFEKTLNKTSGFNSGVMYLNVKNMKKISNQIFDMLKKGIRNPIGIVDQGYLNHLCFDKMTFMPIEFNWKPYWGYNSNAYIVHFHGMKPGGNFANSGFAMNKPTLIKTLFNHWQDINGYVYYFMQYYELLGKDGKEWISAFIAMNFTGLVECLIPRQRI